MYTKFLFTILTVLSFMAVAYCKVAQPQTVEPFMGMGYAPVRGLRMTQTTNGEQCTTGYQWGAGTNPNSSTMTVQPNQLGMLDNQNPYAKVVAASNEYQNAQPLPKNNAAASGQENFQSTDGLNNPGCTQEGYTGPDNFYTVPGTFQSELAPRFQNEGFGADITYNFPEQQHLAAEPDNPLSLPDPMALANQIESFEQQHQENYENMETKFAQVHEPVPLPKMMDGPVRENLAVPCAAKPGNAKGGGAVPQFKTYDSLITASIPKTRITGNGDYIRGDLPIMPDPGQCGWFGSQYANPVYLNYGAMAALTDVQRNGNVAQLQEIAAQYSSQQAAAGAPIPQSIMDKPKNMAANVAKGVGEQYGNGGQIGGDGSVQVAGGFLFN